MGIINVYAVVTVDYFGVQDVVGIYRNKSTAEKARDDYGSRRCPISGYVDAEVEKCELDESLIINGKLLVVFPSHCSEASLGAGYRVVHFKHPTSEKAEVIVRRQDNKIEWGQGIPSFIKWEKEYELMS